MLIGLLTLVAAALAWNAHRVAPGLDPAALERTRRRLGVSFLLLIALVLAAGGGVFGAWLSPAVVLATLAALTAWEAMARLVAVGTRARDLIGRLIFFGVAALAAVALIARGMWPLVGFLAGLATYSYRWKESLPTRRLLGLGLMALALSILGFWPEGRLPAAGERPPAWVQQLWGFANALRVALSFHALGGALALVAAFVRDPSLGVRTVGRRLALSHALVVLVPMLLMAVLWQGTTILGVNRDRAMVGVRSLDADARLIESGLADAVAAGAEVRPRLLALASAWDRAAPGARAFLRDGGTLEQIAGDSLPVHAAISAWLDTIPKLPARGGVLLQGRSWLGAAAHESGRGAVLLVPADSVLTRRVALVVGGRTRLVVPKAESDSSDQSRSGRRSRMNVSGRNYDIEGGGMSATSFLLLGHAFVPALDYARGAWRRTQFLFTVGVSTSQILAGVFSNTIDDPIGYVPAALIVFLGFLLGLVALWAVVMVTNLGRGVASAIGSLHVAARKLETGDLAHRIEVRGDDDLWDVARAVNRASQGLEEAREAEKERERMESELALARRIQARLLPAGPPQVAGLEIVGMTEPAREVGGDYFDHIDLGGGRVALVIADVSGKGVPAALLMSAFRAALVSRDLAREQPDDLAVRLNDFLHRSVDPGKFVTAFVAFLDAASGELHYVNAGHNPSLLLRASGEAEWLSEGGTILGILPVSAFASGRATLSPGDVLVLYTDGVTEGANVVNEQWGEERLISTIRELRERTCEEIARELVSRVRTFEGDTGPADDLTVVVARRA